MSGCQSVPVPIDSVIVAVAEPPYKKASQIMPPITAYGARGERLRHSETAVFIEIQSPFEEVDVETVRERA